MNRFLIALFIVVSIAMVGLAAGYPEDFALALGAFVLGSLLGGVAAYYAFVSIHDKGFERSQQLSLKQVGNPVSMAKEFRIAAKEQAQPVAQQVQSTKPIPQLKITGLN